MVNGSIGTRVRSAIACEQALLFGRAKRERARGRPARSRGKDPSLARSREAHPNRRAWSQARPANTVDSPCSLPLGSLRETFVAADQTIVFVRGLRLKELSSYYLQSATSS